jgi:hypothetical protein
VGIGRSQIDPLRGPNLAFKKCATSSPSEPSWAQAPGPHQVFRSQQGLWLGHSGGVVSQFEIFRTSRSLLISGCRRILRAWQEASSELSTDWFRSIMAFAPSRCLGRDTRKKATSRHLRCCPRKLITWRLTRRIRTVPRGPKREKRPADMIRHATRQDRTAISRPAPLAAL